MRKVIFKFGVAIFVCVLANNILLVRADGFFDSYYGEISWEEEQFHLDNFSIYLKQNPNSIGYIAFFVGKKENLKTVKKRIERARKYLIEFRNIPQNQIVIVNAGRDKKTKIILHPVSKDSPPPYFGCE